MEQRETFRPRSRLALRQELSQKGLEREVVSEALNSLAAKCEKACRRAGLKPEPRSFSPHVTLAYLSPAATLDRVMAFEKNQALFETEPWRVNWFGLYSSITRRDAPSLYRLEAEYPLN